MEPQVKVVWALIPLVASATGYTENAIRIKLRRGIWPKGEYWRKAPDNRIVVNLPKVQQWMGRGYA